MKKNLKIYVFSMFLLPLFAIIAVCSIKRFLIAGSDTSRFLLKICWFIIFLFFGWNPFLVVWQFLVVNLCVWIWLHWISPSRIRKEREKTKSEVKICFSVHFRLYLNYNAHHFICFAEDFANSLLPFVPSKSFTQS